MESYSEILARVRSLGLTEYSIDEWHIKDDVIVGLELGRKLDIYLPYLDGVKVKLEYVIKDGKKIDKDEFNFPHYRLTLDEKYTTLYMGMLKGDIFSEIRGNGIELIYPLSFNIKHLKHAYFPNCLKENFRGFLLKCKFRLHLKDFNSIAHELAEERGNVYI